MAKAKDRKPLFILEIEWLDGRERQFFAEEVNFRDHHYLDVQTRDRRVRIPLEHVRLWTVI
jgi:hypothetical protein